MIAHHLSVLPHTCQFLMSYPNSIIICYCSTGDTGMLEVVCYTS
jgi:hypothetical protein